MQNVLEMACLLTFWKIHSQNSLFYFNVISTMTAARWFVLWALQLSAVWQQLCIKVGFLLLHTVQRALIEKKQWFAQGQKLLYMPQNFCNTPISDVSVVWKAFDIQIKDKYSCHFKFKIGEVIFKVNSIIWVLSWKWQISHNKFIWLQPLINITQFALIKSASF